MSAETIVRHTCDWCDKQVDETKTNWLPCGGINSWSAWEIKKRGNASHMYGTVDASKEFCSHDCAIAWMKRQKEWEELTS